MTVTSYDCVSAGIVTRSSYVTVWPIVAVPGVAVFAIVICGAATATVVLRT